MNKKKSTTTTTQCYGLEKELEQLYAELTTDNIETIMPQIRNLEVKLQLSNRRSKNATDYNVRVISSANRNSFTRFEY